MPNISAGRLSEIIGMIYDSAVEPELWPEALLAIRDSASFANAQLSAFEMPTGRMLLKFSAGVPPEYLESQSRYEHDVMEIWGGAEAVTSYPVDRPVVLSQVRPGKEYMRGRFYKEWADPQGLFDLVAAKIAADERAIGALALGRHQSAGEITEADLGVLELLLPHVQRAVSISRLLDIRTIEARTFAATLDELGVGALMVGNDLVIVHANEAARAMLAARQPVWSDRGRLVVPSEQAQSMLEQAVSAAGRDEKEIGLASFGIPVRREGAPALLHVLPLRFGEIRPHLAPRAVAVVFVAPASTPRPAPEESLAMLFDLTPMEAKVFALLAAGHSVADAAQSFGIGQSTVKTNLHLIFQKPGVKRQSELVRLAASFSI